MISDHIAYFFLGRIWGSPLYVAMRFFGRTCAPIMCFFLVEGFIHTSSRSKYIFRLCVFALISQLAYAASLNKSIFTADFSMIYTLSCIFMMLWSIEFFNALILKLLGVAVFMALSRYGDWGIYACLFALAFYLTRNLPMEKRVLIYLLTVLYYIAQTTFSANAFSAPAFFMKLGLFLPIPLLLLYNGDGGKKSFFNKWFFYILYPAHLLLIYLIN